MAILIPDTPKQCPHGERQVYERFGRELDADWVVLHSLGLVEHERKVWGEIDFVVLSTKGIFVIEVKGGKVSCKNGKWVHEAFGRDPYARREGPWRQAESAMVALQKRLNACKSTLKDVLVGYGVVMPHETFTTTGPEIEPAVLLDSRNFRRNLRFYIGDLQRHWRELYRTRHGRDMRGLSAEEIREVRQMLRPDIGSAFSLGSYFTGLESELVQLTEGQVRAARGLANNPRTVIRGKAGTGKTIVAMHRAMDLAESGLTVLYLCFNQMLAKHVRLSLESVTPKKRFDVAHIHSLFSDTIASAGLSARLRDARVADSELFARVFPETFVEAVLMSGCREVDVLIIDEAQDILTDSNLDALDLLLKDGLGRGRWHFFLDPLQNIYGEESEAAQGRLLDIGFAVYELEQNCRNTKQVALQTSIISGIDMALVGAVDGPSCDCIFFRNRDDFLVKMEKEVTELLKGDVKPEDIIILSSRRRENSLLAGIARIAGLPLADLATVDGSKPQLHYATIQAFKGLERNVVLAVDVDRIGLEEVSMLHYAGLSRARGLLRAFISDSERVAYDAQAVAFGRRIAGDNPARSEAN